MCARVQYTTHEKECGKHLCERESMRERETKRDKKRERERAIERETDGAEQPTR